MTHPFAALGLPEPVVRAVEAIGYSAPTPIQSRAIPALLEGRDVLAAAQTGTGKTAAFALPMIAKMLASPKARCPKTVRALVLAPTRELAAQIDENIRAYCANTNLTTALVFGGVNIRPQTEALARGCDFLIATPGRLLDHAGQQNVELSEIDFFVLDEADRMLDMGFIHDIKKVLRLIPAKRQTLLFSATFNDEIRALAASFLTDPVSVEIARNKESTLIEQQAWRIPKKRKRELLRDLIVDNAWEQVLVFTRMKHTANRLAAQLEKDGIVAAAIHGNKSQSARTKALAGFKDRTVRVLVATDIAARGLDIEGLPHVVNYELPNVPEDYVHRIGRTGRAGMTGHAVSLVGEDETDLLRAIEKLLRHKIELKTAQGYEGEVPEDIARDNAERDKARALELQKMRQARRRNRNGQTEGRGASDKKAVARAVEAAARQESREVGLSDKPEDRFTKKIRRPEGDPPRSGVSPAPRRGERVSERRLEQNRRPRREADERAQPLERTNVRMPRPADGDDRLGSRVRTSQGHRRGAQPARRREADIKSTVVKKVPQPMRDSRFESVSSNLPPGMVLKYRRR